MLITVDKEYLEKNHSASTHVPKSSLLVFQNRNFSRFKILVNCFIIKVSAELLNRLRFIWPKKPHQVQNTQQEQSYLWPV